MSKLEVLNKIVGKTVRFSKFGDELIGEVTEVKNENTVIVKDQNLLHEVDIFDIKETK